MVARSSRRRRSAQLDNNYIPNVGCIRHPLGDVSLWRHHHLLAKGFPNGMDLAFPGRTSTWTGFSVLGFESGGSIFDPVAAYKLEPGGEVRNLKISKLDPLADHSVL